MDATDGWLITIQIYGVPPIRWIKRFMVHTMGGAWLTTHLWQHYLYSGDKLFLSEAYPALKGAADFYLDYLIEHPEYGWMVTAPSMSPEHAPSGEDTKKLQRL